MNRNYLTLNTRLEGIDRARREVDNVGLLKLQRKVLKGYYEILYHEDHFWYQRARKDWLMVWREEHEVLPPINHKLPS